MSHQIMRLTGKPLADFVLHPDWIVAPIGEDEVRITNPSNGVTRRIPLLDDGTCGNPRPEIPEDFADIRTVPLIVLFIDQGQACLGAPPTQQPLVNLAGHSR